MHMKIVKFYLPLQSLQIMINVTLYLQFCDAISPNPVLFHQTLEIFLMMRLLINLHLCLVGLHQSLVMQKILMMLYLDLETIPVVTKNVIFYRFI